MRLPRSIAATPFLLLPLWAQTASHITHTPKATGPPSHLVALPVTRVSLYKNGVGFFEHTGLVTGDAAVTVDFTTAQLNDVLQSLTAIDLGGGRITGAGYNSTTPLDQQLSSLPLALGEDPTAADFYNAIRGARVEVRSPAGAFTGRLLSVEVQSPSPAPNNTNSSDRPVPTERRILTVVGDAGQSNAGAVRSVELTSTITVRLLNPILQAGLSRYLQLLATSHTEGLRHLTLLDRGVGLRELRVSYISEVPVWKSTYRLLLTSNSASPTTSSTTQTATLQGWAVVDNTVGIDWNNVQLSLIAGAPQSFIQPLSDPIYTRRPEVPIAREIQHTPQTHDSAIDTVREGAPPPGLAAPTKMAQRVSGGVAAMSGMAGGSPGGVFGAMGTGSAPAIRIESALPPTYEAVASASLIPQTTTAAFDDLFAYKLTDPVTIRQNESALVPILQSKVQAERVTLVSTNASSNAYAPIGQPLRALWFTNSTGLTLDRGSFSVVEDGNFGGEGLLDPIHPGERRLLSYAVDGAVHVTTEKPSQTSRTLRISASKGVLKVVRGERREITYVLHNAATDPRTVILEHPVEPGLELDSTPKPEETTATVYRWRVLAGPGETTRLHLGGQRASEVRYYLTRSDENQLTAILNSTAYDPALERALQPILAARRRIAEAQTAVDQANEHLRSLRSEEDRERSNIAALATASKPSRDRFVRDLNATEDSLKAVQTDLTTRTATLDAAKADLANRIEQLQLDETL